MKALSLKIAVSLAMLFGLGAATGVVASRHLAPRTPAVSVPAAPVALPVEERWSKARFEEYRTRLDLTPEQAAAIAPHFQKFGQDMRHVREELRGRFAASFHDLNDNIARELTPQQRRELWKLVRERWQSRGNAQRNL